jgi:hypothetical protein
MVKHPLLRPHTHNDVKEKAEVVFEFVFKRGFKVFAWATAEEV